MHAAVAAEFADAGRAEGSRRHLRQASALLHLVEQHGLVQPGTCYVELGAGKGLPVSPSPRPLGPRGAPTR